MEIRRLVACGLVSLLLLPTAAAAQVAAGPGIWQAFTEKVPPGKTLRVRLKNGQRFRATLLQVDGDAMTVLPKTRAPVPPQRIPFERVESLEIDEAKGIGIGKAVAVGAGVAAGAWLALMAFAFAVWGD